MKKLPLVASLLIAVLVIGGAIALSGESGDPSAPVQNVYMEGDKQVVEIDAKGGYSPQVSTAKMGIPTVLRFKTSGTYDCSAAVRIQSLGVEKNLEATGVAEVEVPAHLAQETLSGTCGMGMYNFSVRFM